MEMKSLVSVTAPRVCVSVRTTLTATTVKCVTAASTAIQGEWLVGLFLFFITFPAILQLIRD